jgi:hypothetical protein
MRTKVKAPRGTELVLVVGYLMVIVIGLYIISPIR